MSNEIGVALEALETLVIVILAIYCLFTGKLLEAGVFLVAGECCSISFRLSHYYKRKVK